MAIENSVVVAQSKGGVGKTSVAANLAGVWAKQGRRVLYVMLDPQGDCALDFGYERPTGTDLLSSLIASSAPPVLREVRKGLDVIPAGPALARWPHSMFSSNDPAGDMARVLTDLVSSAGQYDTVIIDTPPGDGAIAQASMRASQHVISPIRTDDSSLLATADLAQRFAAARQHNQELRFSGVVLFAVKVGARRILRASREEAEGMLEGVAPVYETFIRHADSAAAYGRRHGLLAYEIADVARDAMGERFARLRAGQATETMPTNADGLADDYENLAAAVTFQMTKKAVSA